ncbi:MAG: DNA-directed RNA polymerase [archaeon]
MVYQVNKVKGTIRVPPKHFNEDLEETIKKLVQEEYEGIMDVELGVSLAVLNAQPLGEGKIVPGDGAAYYDTEFEVLTYKPLLHEVVEGNVTEITEFGAFIRAGPVEGLIHVSQVMDDFINYNPKLSAFTGRESKQKLAVEDVVKARVVSTSLKNTIADSKVGFTMRQEGLGKKEWKGKIKKQPVKGKKADKRDKEERQGGKR